MKDITRRKDEHIKFAIEAGPSPTSAGFENFYVVHNAIPASTFSAINTSTAFLGKRISAPLMIASLTGGTNSGGEINRRLAKAADAAGIPLALGSAKIVFKEPETLETFKVRDLCPGVPLLANLGLGDLERTFSIDDCKRLIDMIEADAIFFHINPLHEIFQGRHEIDSGDLLSKLRKLVSGLSVPVLVKEVGHGIGAEAFKKLMDCGVKGIDIAGAGGTCWAHIEKLRSISSGNPVDIDNFKGWGIPTASILEDLQRAPRTCALIASGGIRTGVDVFKSLALGADMAAIAKPCLETAAKSYDELLKYISGVINDFKISMYSAGCATTREISNLHIRKK